MDHASRVARFAIDALAAAAATPIIVEDESKGFVNLRIGFHSGPVVASVVGSVRPRYSVYGALSPFPL